MPKKFNLLIRVSCIGALLFTCTTGAAQFPNTIGRGGSFPDVIGDMRMRQYGDMRMLQYRRWMYQRNQLIHYHTMMRRAELSTDRFAPGHRGINNIEQGEQLFDDQEPEDGLVLDVDGGMNHRIGGVAIDVENGRANPIAGPFIIKDDGPVLIME